MQLAIDTSTDNASIALVHGDSAIFELTWKCGQNHTVELLPRLSFLLEQHKIEVKEIDAVFVALGPGSFNGIRVGLSTAKGLAVSLGVPVIGVSTLSIQAYSHSLTGLPVCAIFNAGRGEIATATYEMKDGKWNQLTPERITTLDALIQETSNKAVFCGDYIPEIEGQLKSALGEKAVIPEPSANLRRAVYLAELGNLELKAGKPQNPATLQPIYLRRPAITAPRKRLSYGSEKP